MPIEVAVAFAVPVVGLLWASVLGLSALLTDIRQRRRTRRQLLLLGASMEQPAIGRHRLVQTGRHHLRPISAHVA